jgi:hypothetical protein
MHAKLAQAMAEVSGSRTPRAMLFDQQLIEAELARPVPVAVEPLNPLDNDEH